MGVSLRRHLRHCQSRTRPLGAPVLVRVYRICWCEHVPSFVFGLLPARENSSVGWNEAGRGLPLNSPN